MLVKTYNVRVDVSTHGDERFEYEAVAELDAEISAVLPYLNASLGRAIYLPDKPALSWRHEGRNIGFWPRQIAVDHIESREQVEVIVGRLVELVNRLWDNRCAIEPDHSTHKQLQPLELFRLLPRTNCRMCGETTCFNFALKLVAAQADLEACTPLAQETALQANRQRLEELLATRWPAL
jgi:ArsR family metal-binding transcriptional regulator